MINEILHTVQTSLSEMYDAVTIAKTPSSHIAIQAFNSSFDGNTNADEIIDFISGSTAKRSGNIILCK
jgi:hypothetical protein